MRRILLGSSLVVGLFLSNAQAQECISCWNDSCRESASYLPRCAAPAPTTPPLLASPEQEKEIERLTQDLAEQKRWSRQAAKAHADLQAENAALEKAALKQPEMEKEIVRLTQALAKEIGWSRRAAKEYGKLQAEKMALEKSLAARERQKIPPCEPQQAATHASGRAFRTNGLRWTSQTLLANRNWNESNEYCAENGSRLPTLKEVKETLDAGALEASGTFWTSDQREPFLGERSYMVINTGDGRSRAEVMTREFAVICVR